jgi:hypothetical protein
MPDKTINYDLKIPSLTASKVLETDADKKVVSSTTSTTELGYLAGITPGTATASKALVVDGSVDIAGINDISCAGVTSSDLTATTVVLASAGKALTSSGVTPTELDFLDGATAGTAVASKALVVDGSVDIVGINDISCAEVVSSDLTASRAVVSGAGKALASSATTATELGYVSGVTSAIQTQLNGKADTPVASTEVEMLEIGTATLDDVQDWSNSIQSAGIISGGVITAGGSGTIDVSASTGILKSSNTNTGANYFFDMTGLTAQALTDESTNYIALDYNSGTPQYVVGVTNTANGNTIINLGKVYREGNSVDIINGGLRIANQFKNLQVHHIYEGGQQHIVSGAVVGETGTRNITLTAGIMYAGMTSVATNAIDTSLTDDITGGGSGGTVSANNTIVLDSGEGDVTAYYYSGNHLVIENSSNGNDGTYHVTSSSFDATNTTVVIQETTLTTGADTGNLRPNSFEYYYYDGDAGPAVWVDTDAMAIDNLQYNDVATGLATLASNQYGIHWMYKGTNGFTYVIYGQDTYTLSEAQAAQPPASLPAHVQNFGVLRGKIIIKKSAAAFTEIQNVSDTDFVSSAVSNHNELANIDGGAADDYVHLTTAEYTDASNVATITSIGLAPILSNNALQFLNGVGAYSVPAGGGDCLSNATTTDDSICRYNGTDNKTIQGSGIIIDDSDNVTGMLSLNLKGDYENTYIDAGAMVPCNTNGAATGTNEYGTNDIDWDYFAFDTTTSERVQFKIVMPDSWDLGVVKAKFYWTSATGSTAGDTVEWAMKAGSLADSDAIDTALGTAQVISDTLLANNGTDLQITPATPAITVAGTPALGELTTFEVYRNVAGTDDMTEDAWLVGVAIQYKKLSTAVAIW